MSVVLVAVLFEERAQVKYRARQMTGSAQKEHDQQPSDAAVAIEEGMDRLKLVVHEGAANDRRDPQVIVEEPLPVAQAAYELRWGRWYIRCLRDGVSGPSDP